MAKPFVLRGRLVSLTMPGILRRMRDKLDALRWSEHDRKIATLIAKSGGRMTDEMERRIERHVLFRGNSAF